MINQNKFVSIHQRNLQLLAAEIFKTKNGLNPVIMEDIFKFKYLTYNFRNVETLNRSSVNSVKYGTETIKCQIWKILANDYKELTSLSRFKCKIKNWETDECPYRLCKTCKTYTQRVGFVWLGIFMSD